MQGWEAFSFLKMVFLVTSVISVIICVARFPFHAMPLISICVPIHVAVFFLLLSVNLLKIRDVLSDLDISVDKFLKKVS